MSDPNSDLTNTELRSLALSVAHCPSVSEALMDSRHPCRAIVDSQAKNHKWQLPEAWAGNLLTARIIFLSSNPSISLPDPDAGGREEDYPTADWSDDSVADFTVSRFQGQWATPDGRFRTVAGQLATRPVAFWSRIRDRASELLQHQASPTIDYVMTEVVHCKSRSEIGVADAVQHCTDNHLERVLTASSAPLIVVVGARARDQVKARWGLPDSFGRRQGVRDEVRHLARRMVGGRQRIIAYLPHPTGMERHQTFSTAYPMFLSSFQQLVSGELTLEAFPTEQKGQLVMDTEPTATPPVIPSATTSAAVDTAEERVRIVAAGNAWPFYRDVGAYICPSRYKFDKSRWIGFYSHRTIHGAVARIEKLITPINLNHAQAARLSLSLDPMEQRAGRAIAAALAKGSDEGEDHTIVLLSPLGADETVVFPDIPHHGKSAWTMGHRYQQLPRLLAAKTTDDLVKAGAKND